MLNASIVLCTHALVMSSSDWIINLKLSVTVQRCPLTNQRQSGAKPPLVYESGEREVSMNSLRASNSCATCLQGFTVHWSRLQSFRYTLNATLVSSRFRSTRTDSRREITRL